MPQAIQAPKQSRKASPIEERLNSSLVFSLPEALLPPQLTRLTIIPGDDLDAKTAHDSCATLRTLLKGLKLSPDGKIDYIMITQPRNRKSRTHFEIQLKTGIRPLNKEWVRETLVAAVRESGFDF